MPLPLLLPLFVCRCMHLWRLLDQAGRASGVATRTYYPPYWRSQKISYHAPDTSLHFYKHGESHLKNIILVVIVSK